MTPAAILRECLSLYFRYVATVAYNSITTSNERDVRTVLKYFTG